MIKRIIAALQSVQGIDDYQITVTEDDRHELYFVLGKRETARHTKVISYAVTIFKKMTKDGKELLGSSTFIVPYVLSKKALEKKIEEALYSASFVNNKAYTIPTGDGKHHVFHTPEITENPLKTLDEVAETFESVVSPKKKFNALELFLISTKVHLLNSKGVDYTKNNAVLEVEAIPSFDGHKPSDPTNQKVELYKYFRYRKIDLKTVHADAVHALEEVEARFNATKLPNKGMYDVVIKDEEVISLCQDLIRDLSYAGVYNGATDKKIGDVLQKVSTGEKLTIGLDRRYAADKFDGDGVILTPVTVIKDGAVHSNYGNNRFAQYLGVKPTGNLAGLKVALGNTPAEELFKGPHLEIISLSGIQIDTYSSYIGGEVRLAYFFDGTKKIPVSGFSFSGNLFKTLESIKVSQEEFVTPTYTGPKFIKLMDMDVL
ncbi:MAG: metallopeptidase TldD-related protein [Firmicutes bacterium]|nr:metallopeptidase TldD-related protein [Bacillota bacterium]